MTNDYESLLKIRYLCMKRPRSKNNHKILSTKLTPDQVQEVFDHAARGANCTQIQGFIFDKYKIKISTRSLLEIIKRVKIERSESAKAAYAEAANKFALSDLEILSDEIFKFKTAADESFNQKDYNLAIKLSNTLYSFLKLRIELSGVNQPTQNQDSDIEKLKEEWLKQLQDE